MISVQALSEELTRILEGDAALTSFRSGIRGDGTTGLTEHRPAAPPANEAGEFALQGTYTPYLCVTSIAGRMIDYDGRSGFSDLRIRRRILGVLDTRRVTYEADESLKDFMVLVYAAISSDASLAALSALGAKMVEIVEGVPDGLGTAPQAAFVWDLEFVVAGPGVMRG